METKNEKISPSQTVKTLVSKAIVHVNEWVRDVLVGLELHDSNQDGWFQETQIGDKFPGKRKHSILIIQAEYNHG